MLQNFLAILESTRDLYDDEQRYKSKQRIEYKRLFNYKSWLNKLV